MINPELPQPQLPEIPNTPVEMFPDEVTYHVEERVQDMIGMGYLHDASRILIGPTEPEDLPQVLEPSHHNDECPECLEAEEALQVLGAIYDRRNPDYQI